MSDRRLMVFQQVARLGSFSRAAEALGMTQPAISGQIKTLESFFQTRLLDRSRRGVRLTPEGEVVLQFSERILSLHQDMRLEVARVRAAGLGQG
jgi:molybdate transport repressor ModE-like protein